MSLASSRNASTGGWPLLRIFGVISLPIFLSSSFESVTHVCVTGPSSRTVSFASSTRIVVCPSGDVELPSASSRQSS